jgi:predicted CXXCH cytochrome family protein
MRLRNAGKSVFAGPTPRDGSACAAGRAANAARVRALWLAGVVALAALAGCSTQTKHRWLTFFFDGVPPIGAETNPPPAAIAYDEEGRPVGVFLPSTNAAPAPAPPFTRHPPYEDRQCTECHESKFSVRLKDTQLKVCFACHDDFLAALKVKHQPAENGECTACHDSHGSPLPKMLTKAVPALCSECHDDVLAKGAVKHQPVENGECASCHLPHAGPNKALLVKADPQVCFECHETADLAKVAAHRDQLEQACSRCHDPHAGKEKFFLKPGVARPAAASTASAK